MSIWHPSVYGFDMELQSPLGPNWDFDKWWYRGPEVRAAAPNVSYELVAGGNATFEIACMKAWTSYGKVSSTPGSYLDACPGAPGPYHADNGSYINATTGLHQNHVFDDLIAGCALGIADKEDINDVKPGDITIFSVQKDCVKTKLTNFSIPAQMPRCTGSKCICSWHWQPQTGAGNYYMTGFDCFVSNSPANALPIAPAQPPTWCDATQKGGNVSCVSGSKQPIYWWNDLENPVNKPTTAGFLFHRPSYVPQWSYSDGAQNDIFMPANTTATSRRGRRRQVAAWR